MRLTNLALTMIDNPKMRMKIALKVERDATAVKRWIIANKTDGELTRKTVIDLIMAETSLTEEQIFETETV